MLFGILFWLLACQPAKEKQVAEVPPVGHYEGSIQLQAQGTLRAALDIRHPSPGHYEAELTVPDATTLSFVGDTILYANNQLQLRRPSQPNQLLTLNLDGDFWRGTLQLDSLKTEALLVRRGQPSPSTYRVEELPQNQGSSWLFSPADTSTPGPALALLPDSTTAQTAALWADALAREGVIVLVLPAAGTGTTGLGTALDLLRATPGADTASIGVWATGRRAAALATELNEGSGARTAFLVAQQVEVTPEVKADFRELTRRKLPILGLYGGAGSSTQAARLRAALGGRRAAVRTYPSAGADLLMPGAQPNRFSAGASAEVLDWLHMVLSQER